MKTKKIPNPTIMRLSLYYRGLAESRKSGYILSKELSALTDFSPEQIRQDLSCFGQFGIPGKGYDVNLLRNKISRILGVDKQTKVAVIGIGNLGSALIRYRGFAEQGFDIVCGFDSDRKKVGKKISGRVVRHISELCRIIRKSRVKIAILAVPAGDAQDIALKLASCGIKAILNFAPSRLKVPENVKLLNVDLGVELERLSCSIKSQ